MEDIYALLNINKNLIEDFPLKANNIVDHQTELAINRAVRSLKAIEERMMTVNSVNASPQSIDEIIQKVIDNSNVNNQDMSIWSIRELRIVSYYQIKLQGDDDAYKYALMLLENNWRDMFFNGLLFYCLDNWNMIDPQLRILTCDLLKKKLSSYQDANRKYILIKNHLNFFDEAGPLRMSALISQKKQDLKEAPSYFGNKPSTINQSYYSDVIVNYCNANRITDLELVESIFKIHNLERTKKIVIADIVERLNNNGNELERTKLCKFANRVLGDVTLGSTWAPFIGATENDAKKLKKAKQLINCWFNQRIIETFFEVCVQDRSRKEFWLEHVDKLSSFRIIGSTEIKRLLFSDSRINGMFLKYFKETEVSTSLTAALVLFIKNKMLVEFSDKGALYVYNINHDMVKNVLDNNIHLSTTNDLKITSMNNLISKERDFFYYYEEGRMVHIVDYWQQRLTGWMQQMLLSSSNTYISSFDLDDDDIFKAKPILKEKFRPSTYTQKPVINHLPPKQNQSVKPQQAASRTTTKLNPVVYEKDVRCSLYSKWIFDGKCRVISNRKGYYINREKRRDYIFINGPVDSSSVSGNIWIKRPNKKGWSEIAHEFKGEENTVGYIIEAGGGILFKLELNQHEFMNIKLQ